MYEYYDAVLHAVREGLLLLDGAGRVRLVNDEAARLLDLRRGRRRDPVAELGLPPTLARTLVGRTPRLDELHVTVGAGCWCSTRPGRGGRGATSARW